MKIMFVCQDFPNSHDPTLGVFNLQLARALALQHEIRIIAPISWLSAWPRHPYASVDFTTNPAAEATSLNVMHPRYYYPPKVLRCKHDWFYWHSIRRTVQRLLHGFRPDFILAYWVHPDGAVAARIARRTRVPAAVIVGGSDVLLLPRSPSRRRGVVAALQNMDAVLTVNKHLRGHVIQLGINPGRVHVWDQGVDRTRFFPSNREDARRRLGLPEQGGILLWVGRMVPVKGLDVLIRACRELRNRDINFRLYLVGDGPLRAALEDQMAAQGLSGQISFQGVLRPEELPDWYRAADVTVLPSRSEGLPNVLRESLACGTRFVASDVGGISEIARPGCDWLAPAEDPVALAKVLEKALIQKDDTDSNLIDAVSWEESAKSLVNYLTPLVKGDSLSRKPEGRDLVARVGPKARGRNWRQWMHKVLSRILPRRLMLIRGRRGSSSVCLTFDDGPHPKHTPAVLDLLKKEGIVATFFVVGEHVARYPDIVRRIAKEGHLIGHHSYYHSDPTDTSSSQLLQEVHKTRRLLIGVIGTAPCLFRPPHGKVTAAKLCSLWMARQSVVLWNVDPKDWECESGAELIERCERQSIQGGDVIVLHDNRPHAVFALPHMIATVRKRGLSFGLVSQWTR